MRSTYDGFCRVSAMAMLLWSSGTSPAETPRKNELPGDLAARFQPPAEYAGRFGNFRSPLVFLDGRRVEHAQQWPRRRDEIRQRWHEIMGPWPRPIENPKIEILQQTDRENFTQQRVRIEIAPNQTVDGYLLIPKTAPPFPAVFVPFYEPETSIGLGKAKLDFAYQLTKRGFVTLSIGSPGGDARRPKTGETVCQPLSFLAYVAANCANVLAHRPDVDASRLGTVGHSYGGKWAMFASCLCDRFACAAWSDPGIVFDEKRPNVNYWESWYLGAQPGSSRPVGVPAPDKPRTGAYKVLVENGMDLHELHALMAPRPFFVSGGSEDKPERWTALNHAVAVNTLLGFNNRVGMTNRENHEPTAESNEQLYRFFEHFLGKNAEDL